MGINEREFAQSLVDLVKIGADAERERCAQIAEARAIKLRAKAKEQKSPGSKQFYFAQSIEARVIAEAIRASVGEARDQK